MAFFLGALLVSLVVAAASFVLSRHITWKEFVAQVAVQAVVAAVASWIVSCVNVRDTEIWNGRVLKKDYAHVSCEHSYRCNCTDVCTTDSKGNRTCHEVCQTCYEHSYDVSWYVHTSNGELITIDRVDRQGTDTPPRWQSVVIGDPTAVEHSYDNYVKAAPGSLFRRQGLKDAYAGRLPSYPRGVYDYYRANRLVVAPGACVADAEAWNRDISELNADLGRSKQANIMVVVAQDVPHDWFHALEEEWVGGKKNDVSLVVSVDRSGTIQWAHVMCWTTNELFKVRLRDDVVAVGKLDRQAILSALRTDVGSLFQRKPMKDFQYLEAESRPSTAQWAIGTIVSVLVALGLAWFFHVHDPFDDEWRAHRTYVGRRRR